ncbi:MAG: SOS response-associated peptidase [Thermoplasmatota archaeon]
MCFNITFSRMKDYIEARQGSGLQGIDDLQPVYHASGFRLPKHPVVLDEEPGKLQFLRWGLVPHWTRDRESADRIRFQTLNARSETVFEKPSFRGPIRGRRCLVPVDGFFEFREVGGAKFPYLVRMKDGEPFSLGGIWDIWKGEEDVRTFSIITTEANPLMRKIHNTKFRMPLMLKREDEALWLDRDLGEGEIKELMVPFDETLMTAHPVSRLLAEKGADTNVPGILDKVEYGKLNFLDLDSFP